MLAVLPLGQDAVDHALAQLGAGQAAEQFGIGQGADAFRLGGDVAHAQAAGQGFGKAPHQHHPAQAVQRGQAHGRLGGEIGVGIVLQNQKVMLLGQAQHVVRHGQAQAKAGRVVYHGVGDEQLGPVRGGQALQTVHIRPIAQAWHGQHLHAQGPQQAKHQEPGRVFDQHRIAGAQQAAQHQVHALGHAGDGHQLLLRIHRQPLRQQVGGQLLAQRRIALRRTIAQQLQAGAAPHGAHGRVEHVVVQPAGGQDAGAAVKLRALGGAEHAAQ